MEKSADITIQEERLLRKTRQPLLPVERMAPPSAGYDLFPAFPLSDSVIHAGHDTLAEWMSSYPVVILEGYSGVLWDRFIARMDRIFQQKSISVHWLAVTTALKSPAQINEMLASFLGGSDPLFGKIYPGDLHDFFVRDRLDALKPAPDKTTILYGPGAALANWNGPIVYLDVPKNEIQYRSRAGRISNLGQDQAEPSKQQYKRFYFAEWIVLNKHKKTLLPHLALFVDEQRTDEITWIKGPDLRHALKQVSVNVFRARPWFEAGAWGGNWLKERIAGLPSGEVNYAWSFELITPENGIVLESSGKLLEISFDLLMYQQNKAILGKAADRFQDAFPIRFNFLDTFQGGNLSVQCHPRTDYIQSHFGEVFTQDETYYILDCEENSEIYLGFRDDISKEKLATALNQSASNGTKLDVRAYLQALPAKKHDLFLIPNGTIHCSGMNNLVLEISSTPYLYTFKLYDWQRLDLDGIPRPLNIERGLENLDFTRKGRRVREELVSRPRRVISGDGWQVWELPTHPVHFYRVQRLELETACTLDTKEQAHVLNLVEGGPVSVRTPGLTGNRGNSTQARPRESGREQVIHYAETFVVPAAARTYQLVNHGGSPARLVRAFVKEEHC